MSYGPHPVEAVDLVRRRADVVVRGNHDEALAHCVDCRCAPASKPLAEATRAVQRTVLSEAAIRFLGDLTETALFEIAGMDVFAVHASPRDQLYRYTLTPDAIAVHRVRSLPPGEAALWRRKQELAGHRRSV